jgi:hypothetical protein
MFNMPQGAHRARYNLSQHKLSQQKKWPRKNRSHFAKSIISKRKRARKSQRYNPRIFEPQSPK